jgi:hypothetical protein
VPAVTPPDKSGELTIQNNSIRNLNASGYGDAYLDVDDYSYDIEVLFDKVAALGSEHVFAYLKTTAVGSGPYNYVSMYSVSDTQMGVSVYSNNAVFKSATKTVSINTSGNKIFAQVRPGFARIYFNDTLFGVYPLPLLDAFNAGKYVGLYMPGGSNAAVTSVKVTRS